MVSQEDTISYEKLLEVIMHEGMDGMRPAMELLLNTAMYLERQKHLCVKPHERSEERTGHANGFKPKTLQTRLGEIEVKVPQVREGGFYPQALDKGLRSEKALKLAIAEMYIQGVSTRKVSAITEQLCGTEISSSQVSRASKELDELLEKWRMRPLSVVPYVTLDARYEKVRVDGAVRSCAVLIARGILLDGKRTILGISVSLSEAEVHWRDFLKSLQERGLRGVRLFTSDDHCGLKAARRSVYPGAPWQRCQFHIQQNAQAYLSNKSLKREVASSIRAIFTAPSRLESERLLDLAVKHYSEQASELAKWMESAIPEGLSVQDFPEEHRRKLRTSNGLERVNRELKRRSRVVSIFPNDASCLRLMTAVLMEISEDWETEEQTYMKIE